MVRLRRPVPAAPPRPSRGSDPDRYPDRQPPATPWYHDHALGISRLNVYAGMASFYPPRDAWELSSGLPTSPGAGEIPPAVRDCTSRFLNQRFYVRNPAGKPSQSGPTLVQLRPPWRRPFRVSRFVLGRPIPHRGPRLLPAPLPWAGAEDHEMMRECQVGRHHSPVRRQAAARERV